MDSPRCDAGYGRSCPRSNSCLLLSSGPRSRGYITGRVVMIGRALTVMRSEASMRSIFLSMTKPQAPDGDTLLRQIVRIAPRPSLFSRSACSIRYVSCDCLCPLSHSSNARSNTCGDLTRLKDIAMHFDSRPFWISCVNYVAST